MNLTAELSEVKNYIDGKFVPITPDSYRDKSTNKYVKVVLTLWYTES